MDFTIDFWVRATAPGQGNGSTLLHKAANATGAAPFAMGLASATYNVVVHLSRTSTHWNLLFNGVVGTLTTGATVLCGGGNYASTYLTGNIDELRFSKGIARWTSDFSDNLPTFAYPGAPACYLQMRGRSRSCIGSISSQNQIN
jgi:hypothetical protein